MLPQPRWGLGGKALIETRLRATSAVQLSRVALLHLLLLTDTLLEGTQPLEGPKLAWECSQTASTADGRYAGGQVGAP